MSRVDEILDALDRGPVRSPAAVAVIEAGLSDPYQTAIGVVTNPDSQDRCWRCLAVGELQPATDMCRKCRLYLNEITDNDPSGRTRIGGLLVAFDIHFEVNGTDLSEHVRTLTINSASTP